MIMAKVQDEKIYLVNVIIKIPNSDIPLIIPLRMTPEIFEKTAVTLQAVYREGDNIYDFQQTQGLRTLLGRPVNRRLTGSAVQSEWRV